MRSALYESLPRLRGLLAERAPPCDGDIGAVEALGRGVHHIDHPAVLAGELPMEKPADEEEVAEPCDDRREAFPELHEDLDVDVFILGARDVPLIMDESGVHDPKQSG